MLSIDANILLYAFNTASPWNESAAAWLTAIKKDEDSRMTTEELLALEQETLLREDLQRVGLAL